ncbi:MAG: hypothetical protein RLZZ216_2578 [Cyanobacteriota bacterium]
MGALTAGQPQALVVNVGGEDWDVTTFTGSYDANTSIFATAGNGGVMPWWGDSSLANQFTIAVGNGLGLPNVEGPETFGPYFGRDFRSTPLSGVFFSLFDGADLLAGSVSGLANHPWAQATHVPVSYPLPVLGAAAAFGFSRKLMKRSNGCTNATSRTHIL